MAAWIVGLAWVLFGGMAWATPPTAEEVFVLLGVAGQQVGEMAKGKAIAYALQEGSADELSAGIALYLPAPLAKVSARLQGGDITVDADVTGYGVLSGSAGVGELGRLAVSEEDALALLEAKPGDEFNLSAQEIASFRALKPAHGKKAADLAAQHYREILFQRFEAYRRGGLAAIASYARDDTLDSSPAIELRQAAQESQVLARYFPAQAQAWLNYPAAWPAGTEEQFLWVLKTVEGQPTAILRHVITARWNTGLLMATREFYVEHSYNSSQWITLCLPYHKGTVVLQKVRSFTDQVAGLGSEVKHLVGQEMLKSKMIATWERFRAGLAEQP